MQAPNRFNDGHLSGGDRRFSYAHRRLLGKKNCRIDYGQIARAIHEVVQSRAAVPTVDIFNAIDFKRILLILRWPQRTKSIKHLREIWRNNRGQIRDRLAVLQRSDTDDGGRMDMERECLDSSDPLARPILRKVRTAKRFSASWQVPCPRKTKYCVCKSRWKKTEQHPMIQCSTCNEWYHPVCLGLDDELTDHGRNLHFTCGLQGCPGETKLVLKRGPETILLQKELPVVPVSEAVSSSTSISNQHQCEKIDKESHAKHASDSNLNTILNDSADVNSDSKLPDSVNPRSPADCENVDIFGEGKYTEQGKDGFPSVSSDSTNPVEGEGFISDESGKVYRQSQVPPFETKQTNMPLSPGALSAAMGCPIPSDLFVRDIPMTATFKIDSEKWKELKRNQTGRQFQRGKWEKDFVDGLKKSNPFCVFVFKHHNVSRSRVRKPSASSRLFYASGYCKFKGCPIKIGIEMKNEEEVTVTYTGDIVRHRMGDYHARRISGENRRELYDSLRGSKPHKLFLDKIYSTEPEIHVAGNCDSVGRSRSVMRKIASEALHVNQKDKNEMESLMIIADEMKCKTKNKKIPGFIQMVIMYPPAVFYWTEAGVRIWHDLSKRDVVFWDATGTVVRKTKEGKKFLYYELTCRHPTPTECSIPVSAMVTSCQSQPMVRFWLAEFRRAEKQLYGHGNVSRPVQINSDRSLVFLTAAMEELCGETLIQYLRRAWRIVTGKAEKGDLSQTVVHACAGHVMNDFKRICLKHYKGQFQFGMYCGSLLLNCKNIDELKTTLTALGTVFMSRCVTPHVVEQTSILLNQIEKLPSSSSNLQDNNTADTELNDQSPPTTTPNTFTEEEFLSRCKKSPFAMFATKIVTDVKQNKQGPTSNVESKVLALNRRYGPVYLQQVLDKLLPTIPLWSHLLLGDLRRHGQCQVYVNHNPPAAQKDGFRNISDPSRNTATVEQRFHVLKNVVLSKRSNFRLDEFSVELEKETSSTQTVACLSLLRNVCKPKKKAGKTLEEVWKRPYPKGNLQNSELGKYQQPPVKPLPLIPMTKKDSFKAQHPQSAEEIFSVDTGEIADPDKFHQLPNIFRERYQRYSKDLKNREQSILHMKRGICSLTNVGNSCWFNACLQVLSNTDYAKRLLDSQMSISPEKDHLQQLILIWQKMSYTEEISEADLNKGLDVMSAPPFLFEAGIQHDVHEVISSVLHEITETVDCRLLQVNEDIKCLACDTNSSRSQQQLTGVTLTIPTLTENVEELDIQALLGNYFADDSIEGSTCSHCSRTGVLRRSTRIVGLPNTLVLTLARYGINSQGLATKINRRVRNSSILRLAPYHEDVDSCGADQCLFELTSVVNHHGDQPDRGHYTTSFKCGLLVVDADDSIIREGNISEAEFSGYIFVYSRRHDPIYPTCMEPVFNGLSVTQGMALLAKYLSSQGTKVKTKQKADLCRAIRSRLQVSNVVSKVTSDLSITSRICPPGRDNTTDFFRWLVADYLGRNMGRTVQGMFGLTYITVMKCAQCLSVTTNDTREILCKLEDIKHCSLVGKQPAACQKCNQDLVSSKAITSFGATLAVICKTDDVAQLATDNLVLQHPTPAYPYLKTKQYNFASCVVDDGTVVIRKDKTFYAIGHDGARTEVCIKKHWINNTNTGGVIALFNKVLYKMVRGYTFTPSDNTADIFTGALPQLNELSDRQMTILHCFRGILDSPAGSLHHPDIQVILEGCLSDKHIDVYLRYLVDKNSTSECKVHLVPAAWFAERLLKTSIDEKQSFRTDWMKCDIIIIPANIQFHWILLIVRPHERQILVIDSMSMNRDNIVDRLFQYICFEQFVSKGVVVWQGWKVTDVSKCANFPKQADSINCGIYVCLLCKCLLENLGLPSTISATDFRNLRHTMVTEMLEEYLELHVSEIADNATLTFRDIMEDNTIDEYIQDLISSRKPCYRHENFLKNPFKDKQLLLVDFARKFVTVTFVEELVQVLTALYKKHHLLDESKPYTSGVCLVGEDFATPLNMLCKTNKTIADVYVMEVLVKEVIIKMLMNKTGNSYHRAQEECCETEYSARGYIKSRQKCGSSCPPV